MGNFVWPWRFFSWEIHRLYLVDFPIAMFPLRVVAGIPHQSEHQELAATKTQVEDLEGVARGLFLDVYGRSS